MHQMLERRCLFSRVGTKSLVAVCLTVFLFAAYRLGRMPWGMWGPTFPPDFALNAGALATDLAFRAPWRLISASFLHLSALQLVVSLGALKSQGDALEDRIGTSRLFVVFLVTSSVGFCASRYWYGPLGPVTAGASGAVFGFIGVDLGRCVRRYEALVSQRLVQSGITALLLMLVMPLNNPAHMGALFAGLLLGPVSGRRRAECGPL